MRCNWELFKEIHSTRKTQACSPAKDKLRGNYVRNRNRGIIGKAGSLTLDATLNSLLTETAGEMDQATPPPAQQSILLI